MSPINQIIKQNSSMPSSMAASWVVMPSMSKAESSWTPIPERRKATVSISKLTRCITPMEKMYSPQPITSTAAKGMSCSGWSSPSMHRPCKATSSKVKVAASISRRGEAASREKPVKNRRRSKGFWSAFHMVSVVEPMVMVSPMLTNFRSSIFFPFTSTPDLEPVSQINQPSSRRRSTAWSRLAEGSGR